MTQRLSVTDEIDGAEGTIWMPVQVEGEWLWKRISLDSLSENIRTIVVPEGQTFRIADDADNPSMGFTVSNNDPASIDSNGQSFNFFSNGGTSEMSIVAFQNTNTESEYYGYTDFSVHQVNPNGNNSLYVYLEPDGTALFELYQNNSNGNNDFSLVLGSDGKSYFNSGAKHVRTNLETYADNSEALAAGLEEGDEYNTPDGFRRVVFSGGLASGLIP